MPKLESGDHSDDDDDSSNEGGINNSNVSAAATAVSTAVSPAKVKSSKSFQGKYPINCAMFETCFIANRNIWKYADVNCKTALHSIHRMH